MAVTQPRRISAIAVVRRRIVYRRADSWGRSACRRPIHLCVHLSYLLTHIPTHPTHPYTRTNPPGRARGGGAVRGRGQDGGLQHSPRVADLGPDAGLYELFWGVGFGGVGGCFVLTSKRARRTRTTIYCLPSIKPPTRATTSTNPILSKPTLSVGGVHDARRAAAQAGERPGAPRVLPRHDRRGAWWISSMDGLHGWIYACICASLEPPTIQPPPRHPQQTT